MTSILEIGKLAKLREKTDRDLVRIIGATLKRGFVLASVASTTQSPLYQQAENLHKEAEALLSRVYGLSNAERSAFRGRLLELQRTLEDIPEPSALHQTQAAAR